MCHDPSPEPLHIVHQLLNPQKTPNAPLNFCPCPAPILANSDTSPANSDGPLANFGAFPTATDTYPGSSDLFQSITTTSGQPAFPNDPINVSARLDPRLQPIPAHSIELRQAPPPQLTYPKVLWYPHQPKRPHKLRDYNYKPQHSFARSKPRSSLSPGLHQPQMISHQTLAPLPLITQPPIPLLPRISHTVFCLNPTKTVSFPRNPTSPDLPGSVWITSHRPSTQTISARNVFECSVTSARESCPPRSPCAPKQPHWPANPPSTSLPPTLPTANHPPEPFPITPPPLWATPPAASDAPASPVPLALALAPLAPRCSTPAPTPPSPPMPHLNPPSPIKAPPPMP
ncbi:hypothetical protein E4T56_gene3510 [Termitomyces sp. T112]|nr:hypothetical protein E4T56_gene3510 [Termitomyces sp. T112]